MKKINPNDPAMPKIVTDFAYKVDREYLNTHSKGGMTIRSELAARNMASLLGECGWPITPEDLEKLSIWAVNAADALINELNKEQ